ncbi:MAG: M48 family metalloprotease [Planctomycetes bacterium]|nr:M48 family metalloprotease [Planctomycetota bacterium]
MSSLLSIVISNVVLGAALATVALVVTRCWRNRHVAHVLWVLVLAKLVTPPLWHVPVPVADLIDSEPRNVREPDEASSSDALAASVSADNPPGVDEAETIDDLVQPAVESPDWRAGDAADSTPRVLENAASPSPTVRWSVLLAQFWLMSSVLCAVAVAVRAIRFHRLARRGQPSNDQLMTRVIRLARRIGLRRLPDVRLLDARCSPMVWPLARRKMLLLPQRLVDELTPEQLDTVIAHELAHLVRRDDLVRLLETAVTCLFWWNPVVWYARRELHAAEEDCCDALVVCSLPESRQQYGTALLRAAEMITFGRPLPTLASAFGQQRLLKRRIEMILHHPFRRSPSWSARLILFVLSLVVLPLAATAMPREESTAAETPSVSTTVSVPDGGTVLLGRSKRLAETPSISTTVSVPDGGTVLLGGSKRLAEGRNDTEQERQKEGNGLLRGTWSAVSIEAVSGNSPESLRAVGLEPKGLTMTFDGKTLIRLETRDGGKVKESTFRIALEQDQQPARLTVYAKTHAIRYIYEVKDDTLRLCCFSLLEQDGREFVAWPAKFSTEDDKEKFPRLEVWKRVRGKRPAAERPVDDRNGAETEPALAVPKADADSPSPEVSVSDPGAEPVWGEAVDGLQLAVSGIHENRHFKSGDTIRFGLHVRNVGTETIRFEYKPPEMCPWIAPDVKNAKGERVKIRETRCRGGHDIFTETLEPEGEVSIQVAGILVLGASDTADKNWPRIETVEPGEYTLRGRYSVSLLDDHGKEIIVRDADGTKTLKYVRLTSGTVTFHIDSPASGVPVLEKIPHVGRLFAKPASGVPVLEKIPHVGRLFAKP